MATSRILPATSNPYSQGAVILDSSPYTQFVLNKQAREEANRNAFIKGFQDISSNINAAGLDNNDAQDLYSKKAAWQQYVMGHQKEYQNPSLDNGRTYAEANRLYNDAAQHIQASKLKMANIAEAKKILDDPEKANLLNESFHQKLENARKPISTAGKQGGYEPIDYSSIYNPKPFDETKFRTSLTPFISKETQYSKPVKTEEPFVEQVPETIVHSFKQPDQVRQHAENEYANNPSFRFTIDKMVKKAESDPIEYQRLNDLYKNVTKTNMDVHHPEQIATAYALSLLPSNEVNSGKRQINQIEWEKEKNRRNFGQSIIKIETNKGEQYSPKAHVDEIYNNGIDDSTTYNINGNAIRGREISLPDVLQDKYYDKVGGRVRRPDRVIMDDDKKNVHLIFFNGKTPSGSDIIDSKKSRTIPVTTDIIPDLEKSFGTPKKNLSFPSQSVTSSKPNAAKSTTKGNVR